MCEPIKFSPQGGWTWDSEMASWLLHVAGCGGHTCMILRTGGSSCAALRAEKWRVLGWRDGMRQREEHGGELEEPGGDMGA